MSTTNTWQKLAQPEKTAGQIAQDLEWIEITDGSEKQIKFASDLRSQWIADVTQPGNIANVRHAVVEQVQNGLDLTSVVNRTSRRLEYSYLATDAVNRRAITILNCASAKTIIDYFKDVTAQAAQNDCYNLYDKILRRPHEYQHNGKRWTRIAK